MKIQPILLTLLLISLTFFSEAQNEFELTFGQGNEHRIFSSIETTSGDFLLSGSEYNYPERYFLKSYLISVDGEGREANEVLFPEDTMLARTLFLNLFEIDTQFIAIGIVRVEEGQQPLYQLCYMSISHDLTTINERKIYPELIENISRFQAKVEDDHFVFFGSYEGGYNFGGRMTFDGNLIDLNPNAFIGFANDFEIRKDSVGYVLYGFLFYFVDSSFNFVYKKSIPINNGWVQQGSFGYLNDTSMILSCKYDDLWPADEVYRIIGLGKTDADYNAYIVDYFGTKSDSIDFPAPFQSLDFVDKEHIFLGGTLNVNLYGGILFGDENSHFVLAKYDSLLNRQWKIELGESGYYYFMEGLLATRDKGCLMYGQRYDYINDIPELYVAKVDENGEIVLITTIPIERNSVLSVFPNPFTEEINVSLPDDITSVQLRIVNISGVEIYKNSDFISRNHIDLSYLSPGIYFYQLLNSNGHLLKSGKLIKN